LARELSEDPSTVSTSLENVLRFLADKIDEANPAPPKPDEPEFAGSIVEASCVHDDERVRWFLGFDSNWWPEVRLQYGQCERGNRAMPDDWDSLIDPVVLRLSQPVGDPS
jgi:hypothetical protein